MSVLDDPSYTVVQAPAATSGVAWLRASVARFCEGPDHVRRRALAEAWLSAVHMPQLRRSGSPVANLAAALGLPRSRALAADVAAVARSYQPHTEQSFIADAAVGRLVEACGGAWDETTAARIGLLVQAHDSTNAMIAGRVPPVPVTRRVGPSGEEILVDLSEMPFGAGRHACPGEAAAFAMMDGALAFRRLHDGPDVLVLPNAWDVASARALAAAGFQAIGTTSLGVAATHGLPDESGATYVETMRLAGRLADLPVPVTIDIEAGFDVDPSELAAELSALGIAGVNIEDGRPDGLADPSDQGELIRRLKAGAPELFVNARIDTHWRRMAHDTTLERAQHYVDAGADGIFVPGLSSEREIERLVTTLPVPLNVLTGLSVTRLAELGVRRVSTGSLLFRAALHAAVTSAEQVAAGEAVTTPLSYDDVRRLVG